ncbi:hypothetical protein [Rhodoferax aquaticus]|uniref:Uncharacterized protein n=1 Tax=Rhodoferax aquaticus TaxID=2527691 RepID=A0A515EJ91_9BURK|nr:hypothetical protein [Rhodoferax aquaticus]QDL52746.1 hypothetical protein EXZ61_00345 [Rhodoferax aquaticus]
MPWRHCGSSYKSLRYGGLPGSGPHAILRRMDLRRTSWKTLAMLLLSASGTVLAQPSTDSPTLQYDRYNTAQLEAVCEATPPNAYASGMTDGAWFSFPGAGRTYYYRSACYMELVRRTGRADLCPKVIERRSLWGDGSSHSPQRCQDVAKAYQARQKQDALDLASYAQSVAGAFKITGFKVTPLPNHNWRLEVRTEGTRAGNYVLEVKQIRDNKVLHRDTRALSQPQTWAWELERASVLGTTPLPNIFPMAVSMTFQVPANGSRPAGEHITVIQNFTLSAE